MTDAGGGYPPWAEIYARHGRAMRLAAGSVVGFGAGWTDFADEVVADLLCDLMVRGLPEGIGNLGAYLATAARNHAVRTAARAQRDGAGGGRAHADADGAAEPADNGTGPDAADVTAAVEALPDRHRHVIEARFYARRQVQAIAPDLGVTPQRVSQLIGEALGMLSRALEQGG